MSFNFWPPIAAKAETLIVNVSLFLAIFLASYFIAGLLRRITRRQMVNRLPQKEIATFFSDLLFYLVLVVGLTVGLSSAGLNLNAVIAGLGLGGFALGFALKDIIGNFMSGFLIILTKTVETGDYLKVANFDGLVRSVNLRHTVIAKNSDDGTLERILVPNSNLFSSIITVKKKKDLKKGD